ncbi:MAG TPA: hydroxymethylbilane synthase [Candidatus Cybelea sp.]|jgi:hydroxymethylbilane synthase|nr:hydroxymethylbilane synthase [Candidatus Cybelea sp.]
MLPISLRSNGRRALIVGGGNVAARKAESLAAAGFRIAVVAERIGDGLREYVCAREGTVAERAYDASDLHGASLVVAATNDAAVNERIVQDARAAGVLACDASSPERGDFTMPATLRVGELTISADSAGASPAFSKRVIRELAAGFGPEYAGALETLRRMRAAVKEAFPPDEGAEILRELAQKPVADLARMPERTAVCASRRSRLAMVQSRSVAARLAERGVASTVLGITTSGDRDQVRSIDRIGSVNVFVTEVENALRDGRADYAVHSCKDLPSTLSAGICIAAISRREDPRDAFCSERYAALAELPPNAIVGTSSPRRRAQLHALRPDLRYETLRGNVDTRLRKLRDGEYDAIVLAMAGLNRLKQRAAHVTPFEVEQIVPAVGQGALAVETRAGEEEIATLLRDAVNDPKAELCIECERAALAAMHAGCSAPIGIHAELNGNDMIAVAAVETGPQRLARASVRARVVTLEEARALGAALAAEFGGRTVAVAGVRP